MTSDPAEKLIRRLNDDAVHASEIARAKDRERIVRQQRRHVRTVRSAAEARNRPHPRVAVVLIAALALVIVAIARVHAAPLAMPPAASSSDCTSDAADCAQDEADAGATGESAADTGDEHEGPEPPAAIVDASELDRIAKAAPSLPDTLALAYRAAGLADDPGPGFARRARFASLVPWLGVRVGQNDEWRDVIDPTVTRSTVLELFATWHLDRLVFDANEMRATTISVSRRRERRRLALRVTRTYFAWLRATTAALREDKWRMRAAELGGELDALTEGGWSARRH